MFLNYNLSTNNNNNIHGENKCKNLKQYRPEFIACWSICSIIDLIKSRVIYKVYIVCQLEYSFTRSIGNHVHQGLQQIYPKIKIRVKGDLTQIKTKACWYYTHTQKLVWTMWNVNIGKFYYKINNQDMDKLSTDQ